MGAISFQGGTTRYRREDLEAAIADVAVPARAHHQQDEDTKDVMARSETREIRDRQPAAVTDGGDQGDCAGTKK